MLKNLVNHAYSSKYRDEEGKGKENGAGEKVTEALEKSLGKSKSMLEYS
ncbi:hypothetical protein glysoja_050123 [Glycine soja]|uniref:Uncharacterized protein n=1 Tax=Glycine soja TaxID=3848 RepID=A0A0B2P863_GLYSO|nr:hypothetical protein glysoja_050123 [Glycine soja]